MSNPTSNFGWVMPDATDLVTNLPADFEVFGQAVDTSMADLKGGTTGQILSKTSATDMDFTWIANDQGDITAVGVTSPITGGGTSGAVTIGIQDGTTLQKGALQLTDSTSSTSTTTGATPNSVKSAYDLAGAAIPKTLTTTTGDTIYASAANTPSRLGIGSTGQVLTVSGGIPIWATATSGSMTLLSTTALSGSSTTVSSISGSYKDLLVEIVGANSGTNGFDVNIQPNSANVATSSVFQISATSTTTFNGANAYLGFFDNINNGGANALTLVIRNYASTSLYKQITQDYVATTGTFIRGSQYAGMAAATAVTAIKVYSSYTFTGGTIRIYGVNY